MASLTLKNVPDKLLKALRRNAAGERRSLNQQAIHLLAIALEAPSEAPQERTRAVAAQVAAWRRLAGSWKSDVDPETEARQLSEQRSAGREVDL